MQVCGTCGTPVYRASSCPQCGKREGMDPKRLLAVGLLGLTLSACGGDDGSEESAVDQPAYGVAETGEEAPE